MRSKTTARILIVFDGMIAGVVCNKKLNSLITDICID